MRDHQLQNLKCSACPVIKQTSQALATDPEHSQVNDELEHDNHEDQVHDAPRPVQSSPEGIDTVFKDSGQVNHNPKTRKLDISAVPDGIVCKDITPKLVVGRGFLRNVKFSKYTCMIGRCKKTKTIRDMQIHINSIHPKSKYVQPFVASCGFKSTLVQKFEDHVCEKYRLLCSSCGYSVNSKALMRTHLSRNLKCSGCQVVEQTPPALPSDSINAHASQDLDHEDLEEFDQVLDEFRNAPKEPLVSLKEEESSESSLMELDDEIENEELHSSRQVKHTNAGLGSCDSVKVNLPILDWTLDETALDIIDKQDHVQAPKELLEPNGQVNEESDQENTNQDLIHDEISETSFMAVDDEHKQSDAVHQDNRHLPKCLQKSFPLTNGSQICQDISKTLVIGNGFERIRSTFKNGGVKFKCSSIGCKHMTFSRKEMQTHINTNHPESKHVQDFMGACGFKSAQYPQLSDHICTKYRLFCLTCGHFFNAKSLMRDHLSQNTKCSGCHLIKRTPEVDQALKQLRSQQGPLKRPVKPFLNLLHQVKTTANPQSNADKDKFLSSSTSQASILPFGVFESVKDMEL